MKTGYLDPAMVSSKNHEWETPEVVLDAVRMVGAIGLDPCTKPHNPTGARKFYHPPLDGAHLPWTVFPHELVFVNSPFGRELDRWLRRCALEGKASQVLQLVPARTDRVVLQEVLPSATAVCFWKGRIKFVGAPDGAPFPVAFLYWGPNRWGFARAFSPHGVCMLRDAGWVG